MEDALDLWILDTGDQSTVVLCARYQDDIAVGVQKLDATFATLVATATRIRLALRGKEERLSEQELQNFGNGLFQFLFPPALLGVYQHLDKNAYVRLHVLTNHGPVKDIPWEYLQEPNRPPGPNANRPVVRVVPTVGFEATQFLNAKRKKNQPLRALFVVAEPKDLDPVSWHIIYESFKETLGNKFEVDLLESATRGRLAKKLQRNYQLLHFSGHGSVMEGIGQVILENEEGKAEPVSAQEIAIILANRGLRLVVLAACDTGTAQYDDDFSVVAATLVQANIPAVVATQASVPNQTAAAFAQEFYECLIHGRDGKRAGDVDYAVEMARTRLHFIPHVKGTAALEWGIPTVYRQLRSARVFRS